MTESEAQIELENIIYSLGVESGDCIMLGIDMSKLPLPSYKAELNREAFREREDKWCRFVLDVLKKILGQTGTLLVPSYSYSCTKPGSIFSTETTKSEVGPFTEYFRQQPGIIRSLHPIFSVAGTGYLASKILDNISRSAFGQSSPFSRFNEFKVKFLSLGVEIRNSVTYIHHLEQCSGCPHRFSKSFNIEVQSNGKKYSGEWSAFLGYRGINYRSDITSLQNGLRDGGALREVSWKENPNHLATISDVDKIGYKLLVNDPFAFVNRKIKLQFNDALDSNSPLTDQCKMIVTAVEIT